VLVALAAAGVLGAAAMSASAATVQTTRIMYELSNPTVYKYTLSGNTNVRIDLRWWRVGETRADWDAYTDDTRLVVPEAEVDGIIQYDDGTNVFDDSELAITLDDGTNLPDTWSGIIPGTGSYGQPNVVYLCALPMCGICNYEIAIYDAGTGLPIPDDNGEAIHTGLAVSPRGEAYLPLGGTTSYWQSSMAWWRGSFDNTDPDTLAASGSWANWDDYVKLSDDTADDFIQAYAGQHMPSGYEPEERVNITAADYQYKLLLPMPCIWNPEKHFATAPHNRWVDTLGVEGWSEDQKWDFPEPGSVDWKSGDGTDADNSAPLYYTCSFPVDNGTTATSFRHAQAINYTWGPTETTKAGDYTYSASNDATASIYYTFYGPTVTWHYITSPAGGKAAVTIDDVAPGSDATVDQSSASFNYNASTTWSGLGATSWHTIKITNLGQKGVYNNQTGNIWYVYHDYFTAPQSAADTTNPDSQDSNDGSTFYTWAQTTVGGKTCAFSKNQRAALAFTFTGGAKNTITLVRVTYEKTPYGAMCIGSLDAGADLQDIDMGGSATSQTQTFTTVAGSAGLRHTFLLRNTARRGTGNTSVNRTVYVEKLEYSNNNGSTWTNVTPL